MSTTAKKETLAERVERAIRNRLDAGTIAVGSRLPSEAKFCEEFGVSRTVVREAIATLRSEGRLESRQGSGVYAIEPALRGFISFKNLDTEKVSTVIEMLELRVAIEVEGAGLAAIRRSPAQLEQIYEAARAVADLASTGGGSAEADFAFHMAIADATNNPRFADVLTALGAVAIPRRMLSGNKSKGIDDAYASLIVEEHDRITQAIESGDQDGARSAMRAHLEGSQDRYRNLSRAARS